MALKILMLGWEFPPFNSGGLGVACQGMLNGLSVYEDLAITFVLPKKLNLESENHYRFLFAEHNVTFRYFDSILSPYLNIYTYRQVLERVTTNPEYALTLEQEVYRYSEFATDLASQDFDIIHAHDWLTFPLAQKLKKLSNKPLIIHIHATEVDRSNDRTNFIFEIERQTIGQADKIITVSEYTKQVIISQYNATSEKCSVVHNGINLDDLNLDNPTEKLSDNLANLKGSGVQLVVFVGRLTYQKGIKYLLEAAKKVINLNQNALFIIAGSGDLEEHLLHQSADHGISHKVVFTGKLNQLQLKSLYKAADIFVMPSISEPFGLVALEAGAQNTPLILSRTSGVSEVLNNALKVDFWDTELMASHILAILEYSALGKTMVSHTNTEISEITWIASAEKIRQLYYTC